MLRNDLFSFPAAPRLRAYVAAVTSLGAAAIVIAAVAGTGSADVPFIAALIIAGAASERFKIGLFGDSHVSLSAVACMTAALVGGPRDAVLVASCLAITVNLGGIVPLYKTAFNIAVYALASLAFSAVLQAFPGVSLHAWPQIMLPAILGVLAYFCANAGLVAGAVAIASKRRVLDVARENYFWLLPHYLPLGALAAAMASGHGFIGTWAIPLFALPLASIQVALFQYSILKTGEAGKVEDAEDRIRVVEAELTRLRALDQRMAGDASVRLDVA